MMKLVAPTAPVGPKLEKDMFVLAFGLGDGAINLSGAIGMLIVKRRRRRGIFGMNRRSIMGKNEGEEKQPR